MNISCGTDIIEVQRIKYDVENIGFKFLNRVFTDNEIKYCESRKTQKYQHYAGRFAAKEAAFKAVSKSLDDKYSVCWKDFEVINDKQGRPKLNLSNVKTDSIKSIDISISHCELYAIANVTVLYRD